MKTLDLQVDTSYTIKLERLYKNDTSVDIVHEYQMETDTHYYDLYQDNSLVAMDGETVKYLYSDNDNYYFYNGHSDVCFCLTEQEVNLAMFN